MCEYCLEATMLTYLAVETKNLKFDEINTYFNRILRKNSRIAIPASDSDYSLEHTLATCILQEIEHPKKAFAMARYLRFTHRSIDVLFCKGLESFIDKDDDSILRQLAREIGTQKFSNYFEALERSNLPIAIDKFGNASFCKDNALFNAEQLLENYINFRPNGQRSGTPIVSKENYYLMFPSLYFSICLVAKKSSSSNLLQKISTTAPKYLSNYFGFDLWIRRKSTLLSIKANSAQFFYNNHENIDREIIYYSLLKHNFSIEDLLEIKKILLKPDEFKYYIDLNTIIKLIDEQILKLSKN